MWQYSDLVLLPDLYRPASPRNRAGIIVVAFPDSTRGESARRRHFHALISIIEFGGALENTGDAEGDKIKQKRAQNDPNRQFRRNIS